MPEETDTTAPLLLTSREAAALLKVSEKTLGRISAPKGTLPCVRPRKRVVRYTAAAIRQWIADQEAESVNGHGGGFISLRWYIRPLTCRAGLRPD